MNLITKRILTADDPDYRSGLDLLWEDGRIDPNLIDTPEDFYWWMRGWEKERRPGSHCNEDYVFVVKSNPSDVMGFLYSEYYTPEGWLYVSYLVARGIPSVAPSLRVAQLLFECMDAAISEHTDAKGVIYELGFDEYCRSRDRLFRFHAAQHGYRLRKTKFLQPALTLLDASYAMQEECLCVASRPGVEVDLQAISHFMFSKIFITQDQGSLAYQRHCHEVESAINERIQVGWAAWFEAWHPENIEPTASPRSELPAESSPRPSIRPEQGTWFLQTLSEGCSTEATLPSSEVDQMRREGVREDIFVDETRLEIAVRGRRPQSFTKLGSPQRALLWLALSRPGNAVSYADLGRLLRPGYPYPDGTIQAYRSRLARALGRHLAARMLHTAHRYQSWVVPTSGWSFRWIRKSADPLLSALIQDIIQGR